MTPRSTSRQRQRSEEPLTVNLSHPTGLLQQSEYAPVATATGTRTVLLAGQAAATPAGEPTSNDLAEQVHSALKNVAVGVRGAGGDVDDIARLTIYVVNWNADMATALFDGISRAQELEGYRAPMPPLTVIGVQALWTPDFLVEIEATAILV